MHAGFFSILYHHVLKTQTHIVYALRIAACLASFTFLLPPRFFLPSFPLPDLDRSSVTHSLTRLTAAALILSFSLSPSLPHSVARLGFLPHINSSGLKAHSEAKAKLKALLGC